MYAKIVNGQFTPAPNPLVLNGCQVFNPTAEQLAEAGYLPVVETAEPEAVSGYYFAAGWAEENGAIVRTWTQTELPPAAPTTEERIAALEAIIQAQAEALEALGVTQ